MSTITTKYEHCIYLKRYCQLGLKMSATVAIDFVMDDLGGSGCCKVRHDVDFDVASAVDSRVEEMYFALLE